MSPFLPMARLSTNAHPPRPPSELQSLSHAEAVQEIQRLEKKIARGNGTEPRTANSLLPEVSHELRSPLTSMILMAENLSQRVADDQSKELAELIESSGRQLQDTLNAVLTLANLEADQDSLTLRRLSVPHEVESVVRMFEQQAESKGLDYSLAVEESEAPLYASLDSGALTSIVQNLITNALRHTETGGVHVSVRPVSHSGSQMVEIAVADTGVGISESFGAKVFDRFEQAPSEDDGAAEGTGLGLTLARRFTERMGGTIDFDSTKGQGTTFRVCFPRVSEHESSLPAPSPPSRCQSPRTEKEILFIEENLNTQRAIRVLLENRWGLTTASCMKEGLDLLSDREASDRPSFHLVLLGVERGDLVPDDQFLQELEERTDGPNLPVVALAPGTPKGSAELDVDGTISEPFTSSKLVVELLRYLEEE